MTGFVYELVFPHGSYIGSTKKKVETRVKEHLNLLKKNKHFNIIVQSAYNKYGEFTVKTIEEVNYTDIDEIKEREQYYLDTLKPVYNISRTSRCPSKFYIAEDIIAKHYNLLPKSHKSLIIAIWAKGKTYKTVSKEYNITEEIAKKDLDILVSMNLLSNNRDYYYINEKLENIFNYNGLYK